MSSRDSTEPKVFIIESLTLQDESENHFEGEIIHKILNLSNVKSRYEYIRTDIEFTHFLKDYERSEYRYLHISMHGDKQLISTTFNNIDLENFVLNISKYLDKRRLFLSCCSFATDKLAEKIFAESDCYSIVGFNKAVNYNDAAIFWATFYHHMFNRGKRYIKYVELKSLLKKLMTIYKLPIVYYQSSSKNTKGYKKINLE